MSYPGIEQSLFAQIWPAPHFPLVQPTVKWSFEPHAFWHETSIGVVHD